MKDQISAHSNESRKRKMKNKRWLLFFLLFLFAAQTHAQAQSENYSMLFYNVENLFDPEDDPATSDEEFISSGERHWTYSRMNKKLLNISKVILSAAGWSPPEIIGLCEVENRFVLEKLLSQTPLKMHPYKIIHKESPDDRGIDVAFLYNEENFYPLSYRYFPLVNENDSIIETREILYVSGILNNTDTLHFFINHWPSRYGGLLETQHLRNLAAKTLRNQYENIQKEYGSPKVIIMGDFNDQPNDESIKDYLKIADGQENTSDTDIVNLSFSWLEETTGTIKYQTQWSVFDQVMVSGSLINADSGISTNSSQAKIVNLPFLLVKDERHGGIKPKRTFYGYDYIGGFSDHLPVLLRLKTIH